MKYEEASKLASNIVKSKAEAVDAMILAYLKNNPSLDINDVVLETRHTFNEGIITRVFSKQEMQDMK